MSSSKSCYLSSWENIMFRISEFFKILLTQRANWESHSRLKNMMLQLSATKISVWTIRVSLTIQWECNYSYKSRNQYSLNMLTKKLKESQSRSWKSWRERNQDSKETKTEIKDHKEVETLRVVPETMKTEGQTINEETTIIISRFLVRSRNSKKRKALAWILEVE